jgi:hypothetical protein
VPLTAERYLWDRDWVSELPADGAPAITDRSRPAKTNGPTETAPLTEWVYTAAAHQNLEVGWDGASPQTVVDVEVERGLAKPRFHVGLTEYLDPQTSIFTSFRIFANLAAARTFADDWAADIVMARADLAAVPATGCRSCDLDRFPCTDHLAELEAAGEEWTDQLTLQQAGALLLDGTGRNGDPRFPFRWSNLSDDERWLFRWVVGEETSVDRAQTSSPRS